LRILALPNAKDPDELIRGDATAWPTLVREAIPVIDFVLRRLGSRHDLNNPQGKRAAAEEMLQVLVGIADPIEQDHFVNEVASLLATRPETIRGLLRRSRQPRPPTPAPARADPPVDRHDAYLLALLTRLHHVPALAPAPNDVEFIQSDSRAVYHALGGPLPPELQHYGRHIDRQLELVERLSPQEFPRELERTRLEIKKLLLRREQEEISALARDSGMDVRGKLSELASAIDAIDRQLVPERESAGIR
jgi:DNA primase